MGDEVTKKCRKPLRNSSSVVLALLLFTASCAGDVSENNKPVIKTTPVIRPPSTQNASSQPSTQTRSESKHGRDASAFVREIMKAAPTMGSSGRQNILDLGDDVCRRYRRGETTVNIVSLYGKLARESGFPTSEATAFVAFAPIFLCPEVEVL